MRQAFDGGDFLAARIHCQRHAGKLGFAVDVDGAGAALAPVTDFLAASELELVAQRAQQRGARLDGDAAGFAVNLELDFLASGERFGLRAQYRFGGFFAKQAGWREGGCASDAASRPFRKDRRDMPPDFLFSSAISLLLFDVRLCEKFQVETVGVCLENIKFILQNEKGEVK